MLIDRRDNRFCRHCTEVVFARLLCPADAARPGPGPAFDPASGSASGPASGQREYTSASGEVPGSRLLPDSSDPASDPLSNALPGPGSAPDLGFRSTARAGRPSDPAPGQAALDPKAGPAPSRHRRREPASKGE